ncbi:MAG: outer membrane protein assembly factor BamB [Cyclobacteriaceae bacterium]|jgi:outer membrane protein assembly factor BamB
MKTKIKNLLIGGLLIFSGCSKDDKLPKANVILNPATDLEVTAGHELLTASWDAPISENVIGYVVRWSPDSDSLIIDASEVTATIFGVTNGQEYIIDVRVNYGDDGSSQKLEGKGTPIDQLNFNAFPGSEYIQLEWSKPDRQDITGYNVKLSPGNIDVDLEADALSYTINGLTNDSEYTATLTIQYAESSGNPVVSTATPGFVEMFLSDTMAYVDESINFAFNPTFNSNIVSYAWDFGDGSAGTESSVNHAFTSAGKYEVTLEITDDGGTKFSDSRTIHVIGVNWEFIPSTHIKGSMATQGNDGTLYVGDSGGQFFAINPDGTQKWKLSLNTDSGNQEIYDCAPAIGSDGTIYVTSQNGNLYAINPAGSVNWIFTAESGMRAGPALASNGTVYINDQGGKFYAINSDGTKKWDYAHGGGDSNPAVDTDGTIYFGSKDANLYALNPDGSLKWNYTAGDVVDSSPVIGDNGTVYFGARDNKLYAVAFDGTLGWTFDFDGERTLGAPVIGLDGTIYVGARDKKLYAISSAGAMVWSQEFSERFLFSAATLDANGYLYIGNENGVLYGMNQVSGEIIWELQLSKIFSTVTLGDDGNIYVGTLVDTDFSPDPRFVSVYGAATGLANSSWPTKRQNSNNSGSK